jgi:hypothetical protein
MRTCPSCGAENADEARSCSACGTELSAPVAARGEERKVVSVLFVDLVGFAARSGRADPEDVRATLRVCQELLKREIERFGGTGREVRGRRRDGRVRRPGRPRGRRRADGSGRAPDRGRDRRAERGTARVWTSPSVAR